MKKKVMLIGFMGSGKTTVGIKLSYLLRKPVEDTDKIIERRQGRSISEIFAREGEGFFRELETKLLEEIRDSRFGGIYSVGGGLPVCQENRKLLAECGTVVYLRVTPETVYQRVKHDKRRPLLQCEDPLARIRELLLSRSDAYEDCADIIIDADRLSVSEVAREIAAQLQEEEKTV